MTFILQRIKGDHGKYIPAKIGMTAAQYSPTAIILPGKPVLGGYVMRFAEMLINHGLVCCLPSIDVDAEDANKRPSRSINHPSDSWELEELDHAIRHMRSRPGSNGKVAVIGFGHGGQQAFLAACRLDPETAIIYHGTRIEDFLKEGRHIDCQTVFHVGNSDPYMTGDADRKIHAALIGKFNIAIYKYDAGEAFTNEDDPVNYAREPAQLAHKRTLDILGAIK